LHRANQSARFITTHGFGRPNALKAACALASSASTVFAALLVFKFGNDSVTAASIRASIKERTAHVILPSRFHPARSAFTAFRLLWQIHPVSL
jgi:hypothetical protein